jgi:hypothetical protein
MERSDLQKTTQEVKRTRKWYNPAKIWSIEQKERGRGVANATVPLSDGNTDCLARHLLLPMEPSLESSSAAFQDLL